jgi:hypothetical protein
MVGENVDTDLNRGVDSLASTHLIRRLQDLLTTSDLTPLKDCSESVSPACQVPGKCEGFCNELDKEATGSPSLSSAAGTESFTNEVCSTATKRCVESHE